MSYTLLSFLAPLIGFSSTSMTGGAVDGVAVLESEGPLIARCSATITIAMRYDLEYMLGR